MMIAAILSVTVMAIVAFALGFVCGKDAGRQQAERAAAEAALNRQASFRKAAAAAARPHVRRPGPFPANREIREGEFGAARS